MEAFVDLIMETDRKARALIDQAQEEKKQILAGAEKRANAELQKRQAVLEQGKREVDAQLAQDTQKEREEMDKAYLDAKHALDATFEENREHWLDEIQRGILGGQA
ncbi:hypothetical protein [uncultured Ruthenibacterium sp.]|uniref:hypothetical protein n=1 Tax=uncultured Ruthenibacterium sp. TaxID=1905347 RepID=UPI00349EF70F